MALVKIADGLDRGSASRAYPPVLLTVDETADLLRTTRRAISCLASRASEDACWRQPEGDQNGELLDAAEAAGFDVFVTTDRHIAYRQEPTVDGNRGGWQDQHGP